MKKLISMCIALALAACACTAAMAGSIDDDGHFTYDNSPHIHFQPSGEAFFITDQGGQDSGPELSVEDKYCIVQDKEGYWCYPECVGMRLHVTDKLLFTSQIKDYDTYDPKQIREDLPEERYNIDWVTPVFTAGAKYLVDAPPEKAWFLEVNTDLDCMGPFYREITEEERAATEKLKEKAQQITPGDINKDDKIDIKDALLALRISIGLEEMPNEKAMPLVDMDKNGEATVVDALYLLQISVGLRQA